MKSLLIAAAAAATLLVLSAQTASHANEVMTDRCSREVAFPPGFNDRPDARGTIVLQRGRNGWSAWSPPFQVRLGRRGHVRWWCNSTTGNVFDPGTWRLSTVAAGAACASAVSAAVETGGVAAPGAAIACRNFPTANYSGWTAERSRCNDRSTWIRARLGPGRLLQTECLGRRPPPRRTVVRDHRQPAAELIRRDHRDD